MIKGERCLLLVCRIVCLISIDSLSLSRLFLQVSVWTGAGLLRHGRDALLTWDSITYWERGTKGPGSGF